MLIIWEVARVVDIKDMSRTMLMQKNQSEGQHLHNSRSKEPGVMVNQTGPARFRFGPVSNRPKFKIQI